MTLQAFVYQMHTKLCTLGIKYAFSRRLKFVGHFH